MGVATRGFGGIRGKQSLKGGVGGIEGRVTGDCRGLGESERLAGSVVGIGDKQGAWGSLDDQEGKWAHTDVGGIQEGLEG